MKIKLNKFLIVLSTAFLVSNLMHSQSWTPIADMGDARYGAVSFSIGNKGYVAVGQTTTTTKNSVWEYDPIDDTWSQKANFAGGNRRVAFGFSIGDKGYVGCGRDDSGTSGNGVLHSDFWEFNPINNTWTQKANFGGGNRETLTSFVIGNYGYAGLGLAGSRKYDFWKYNPLDDTWLQLQNINAAYQLYHSTAFVLNGYAYYGLGSGFNSATYSNYTSTEIFKYNPVDDSWTQMTNFGGAARSYATSFILDNQAYLGLGWNGTYLSDVWRYNETDDSWDQTNISGVSRGRVSTFAIDNNIYLGNGNSTSQFHKEFFVLDKTSLSIQELTSTNNISIVATSQYVRILFKDNNTSEHKISIYNSIGQLIVFKSLNPVDGEVLVSHNLQKGMYIVTIQNSQNGSDLSKKIIVN